MRARVSIAIWCAGTAIGAGIWSDVTRPQITDAPSASAVLRQIVASGRLAGLRWPNFRDVQPSLSSVYEQCGYTPLWLRDGKLTAQGEAVLEALRMSAARGLPPDDFDALRLADWARRQLAPGSAELANLDAAITINLMRYASALHQGRVDPSRVHFAIRQKRRLDPAALVRDFVASPRRIPDRLSELEPPFPGYRRTLDALNHYQQLASQENPQMPPRPRLPLKRGQTYSDLSALAERLVLLGDLPSLPPQTESHLYDGTILQAVQRFQTRHGLSPTGTLDDVTWRAITTPLAHRVEQLQLTLERWRWLPASVIPAIVVNIPEFELRAYDEHRQLALRMHVIVGKAWRHRTPVFEDNLESVIIRPWWNVPLSIQRNEMVPKIRTSPGYLAKNNLQVINQREQPVSAASPQDLLIQLRSGALRLRQQPGPTNSLGLLKFDFPNDYSVYMHGTPARQLFARARRDFSHGCIRVEDPDSLAVWVLRNQPEWNRDKIAAACNGDRTIRIPVTSPVAVLILYATSVVEEDGSVHFFEDLYGHDKELAKALAAGFPYPPAMSSSAPARDTACCPISRTTSSIAATTR